ncbi:MAG: hypothetical protein ACOY0T_17805 [Myxococcota bacterium]
MRKNSLRPDVAKSIFEHGVLALVACLGAAGCSASADCKPAIESGTTFKVTVMSETANSDKCHIIDIPQISPFKVQAAKTEPTYQHPDCSVTPMAAPPAQMDVIIKDCIPGTSDMLSLYCNIQYPATCDGSMSFWFAGEKDKPVDWKAPVIENVFFRVKDDAPSCLPDIANCFDEYLVKLERQN